MIVTIYKYDATGPNQNYFDRASGLIYVDKIIFTRQLIDNFPIFKEEWSQEGDVNILKTGYFDLKFPLYPMERSITLSKTLLDFFENLESGIKNYKYIVVCETDNPDRNYSGVVDTNSLKDNRSLNEGQYHLTVSVTGIEKEFIDCLKENYITRLVNDEIFETQYLQRILYWASPNVLQIRNRLELRSKLGYYITIDKFLQNKVWDANLDPNGTACIITNWEAFKSFLVGYGFRFKLILGINDNIKPGYFLTLYFRSEGINRSIVDKYLEEERGLILSGNKYVALFYSHAISTPDIEYFTGIIISNNDIVVSDQDNRFKYNNKTKAFTYGSLFWREEELKIIDLTLYGGNLQMGTIAICRCVAGYDINPLLDYIARWELGYLIEGVKQARLLKCKVTPNSGISVGHIVVIDRDYVVERINSFDDYNGTMEIELLET